MTRILSLALLCLVLPSPAAAQESTPQAPPRAKLGKPAPDFSLTDLNGKTHRLSDYSKAKKVVVLEWFNPGCPSVKKAHSKGIMTAIAKKYKDKGVVWLAINSGGSGKQGHGVAVNKAGAKRWSIAYPILPDEKGTVGRMYQAKVTPHLYVVDATGKLVYKGAVDNRREPNTPEYVGYVEQAVIAALKGKPVATPKTRAYG
ncbi:MAG: redoxin domain-containing protein [Planctomycetes bacterium]|nr:redoxin domain-containing protein [Planctomycetota bacterium]